MTAPRIEQEIKLSLASAADYERLCARLGPCDEEFVQQNAYFDFADGRLAARGILLRVRIEHGRAWLTRKDAAERTEAGVFRAPESEEALSVPTARELVSGVSPFGAGPSPLLAQLASEFGPLDRVRLWGRVENVRRCYRLPSGVALEVDRTSFPDGSCEHELEVETVAPERVLDELRRLLADSGVDAAAQTRTKAERLRERLRPWPT